MNIPTLPKPSQTVKTDGKHFSSLNDFIISFNTKTYYKIQNTRRETKELGMETHPGEGVVKEEKFPNTRKPSHKQVCEEFWNLRGQDK